MGSRWLYCFTYWLARLVFFSYYGLSYRGFGHLPPGPSIVVCNHIRAMDPPVLASLLPRPAWFMTKVELFQYWGLSPLIRALHAYPVKRGRPDRKALTHTLRILKAGGIVLIFPEGHRSETGELQAPRRGVAVLARSSGVPVVPVGVVGPYGFRKPVTFSMGEPFYIGPDENAAEASRRIMREIAAQVAVIRAERGLAPLGSKV
ncbi:MAG: lysophospholipid acyltransferase family protein [Clostridia bacterium]